LVVALKQRLVDQILIFLLLFGERLMGLMKFIVFLFLGGLSYGLLLDLLNLEPLASVSARIVNHLLR
jgi:hypothetical protein